MTWYSFYISKACTLHKYSREVSRVIICLPAALLLALEDTLINFPKNLVCPPTIDIVTPLNSVEWSERAYETYLIGLKNRSKSAAFSSTVCNTEVCVLTSFVISITIQWVFHKICKFRRSLPVRFAYGWVVMQSLCFLRTVLPFTDSLFEVNNVIYHMITLVIIYNLTSSIQKILANMSFIPTKWFIITISLFDLHKRIWRREIIGPHNW